MRAFAWRLTGALAAITALAPLAMLILRDRCEVWHGGAAMPPLALAAVACNAMIGSAYMAIPAELWLATRSGLSLPRWLTAAVTTYAAFILFCGATHFERALTRPVIYCAESVVILATCAALSVAAWAWTRACRPAIEQTARLLATMPEIVAVLDMSPGEAAEALRRVRRGLADARAPAE